jgi:hypothetical protein
MRSAEIITIAASIATILGTIILAITALVYVLQLRSMNKARQLDSMLSILSYLDNQDLRRVRFLVFEHSERLLELLDVPFTWENWNHVNELVKRWSENRIELYQIDVWINTLNKIAFLIRQGYTPVDVLPFMRNPFLRCWGTFHPYIKRRREYRMGLPDQPSTFAIHLEWAVKKVKEERFIKASKKMINSSSL